MTAALPATTLSGKDDPGQSSENTVRARTTLRTAMPMMTWATIPSRLPASWSRSGGNTVPPAPVVFRPVNGLRSARISRAGVRWIPLVTVCKNQDRYMVAARKAASIKPGIAHGLTAALSEHISRTP
jgi:hypothetical protein